MSREITNVLKKTIGKTQTFRHRGTVERRGLCISAVGPTLRGSGNASDTRKRGYAVYGELSFEPMVETAGDCFARCMVRVREIYQSFDLIYQAIGKIPDTEIDVKVVGNPPAGSETFMRLEQPRASRYYLKGSGTKFLQRFGSERRRSPISRRWSWPLKAANWPTCPTSSLPSILVSVAQRGKKWVHLGFLKWSPDGHSKARDALIPICQREPYANTRGSIEIDIQNARFARCARKVPDRSDRGKKTEKIWEIDRLRCISCAACVDVCPKKCLSMLTSYSPSVTSRTIDSFTQEQPKSPSEATVAAE